jgi:hypothetical protein
MFSPRRRGSGRAVEWCCEVEGFSLQTPLDGTLEPDDGP